MKMSLWSYLKLQDIMKASQLIIFKPNTTGGPGFPPDLSSIVPLAFFRQRRETFRTIWHHFPSTTFCQSRGFVPCLMEMEHCVGGCEALLLREQDQPRQTCKKQRVSSAKMLSHLMGRSGIQSILVDSFTSAASELLDMKIFNSDMPSKYLLIMGPFSIIVLLTQFSI